MPSEEVDSVSPDIMFLTLSWLSLIISSLTLIGSFSMSDPSGPIIEVKSPTIFGYKDMSWKSTATCLAISPACIPVITPSETRPDS